MLHAPVSLRQLFTLSLMVALFALGGSPTRAQDAPPASSAAPGQPAPPAPSAPGQPAPPASSAAPGQPAPPATGYAPSASPLVQPQASPPPAGQTAPPPYYGQPAPYGQPTYGAQPPVYNPAYVQQPAPVRPPRPRKGLMVSGISVLGASYIISAISGAVLMDISRASCDRCRDVGPMLLIPVAGPFIAISRADAGRGFLGFLGVLEVAGLGMTVGGIILYTSSKRAAQTQGFYSLDLPQGRSLSFDLHTSPLQLGPSARLRF